MSSLHVHVSLALRGRKEKPPRSVLVRRQQQGFGLLEAIVALVLISFGVVAAYDWINTNLITISRIQDIAHQTEAKNNIRAYLTNLNPAQSPAGQQAFTGYRIEWNSKVLVAPRNQVNRLGVPGLYQVGLYRVVVNVYRPGKNQWFHMNWRQVGYRGAGQ